MQNTMINDHKGGGEWPLSKKEKLLKNEPPRKLWGGGSFATPPAPKTQ